MGDAGIAYQHAYLQTILAHAGVSASRVHEVNVGANLVPAMVSGQVNATLGGYWNYEAIQLAQAKQRPNVIRVDRLGVPSYDELVLVVKRGTITNHSDLVRRFVQALARGYEAVRSDPQTGVQSLLHANPGLDANCRPRASARRSPPSSPGAAIPGAGRIRCSGTPTASG